jgi:hypothetical protein
MFIVLFDFVLFKAFACKTESEFDDLIMKLRQVKNDLFLMEIFIIFS